MKCKVLISTETLYKDGTPHIMTTGIDSFIQRLATSVEFDYKRIFDREDKYQDVVGFYHTRLSGPNIISPTDIETMSQWVRCLGKSLVCAIETEEELNGWVFIKGDEKEVKYRPVQVLTDNDVNYDIWFESRGKFWSPVDFLIEGEYFDESQNEEPNSEILAMVKKLTEGQKTLSGGFNILTETLQDIIQSITKE